MANNTDVGDAAAGTERSARLDTALVSQGLARSRTHAARMIVDGLVSVDGLPVVKASTRVDPSQRLDVEVADLWVSRAAHKLIAALDAFEVTVDGQLVLDVGASTGGFTQVVLERGAREVIALDVGHAQLAASIASDQRVRVVEGVNARYLTAAQLAEVSGVSGAPRLVVGDLSFISLVTVLPALRVSVARDAEFVLLIKPQFEVGRSGIREGVVRDPRLREEAITAVLWAAWDQGLSTAGIISSPIIGNAGNREYLVWLSPRSGSDPSQWSRRVASLTRLEF